MNYKIKQMKEFIKKNSIKVCTWVALLYFITLSYSDAYITNVYKREKIQLEEEYNHLLEKQKEAYKTIVMMSEKINKLKNQNKKDE